MANKDNPNNPTGTFLPASYRPQGDGITSAGQEVINNNADIINAFITRQRQAIDQSGLDQHRRTFTSPDLDIEYHYQFGSERITLTPYISPVVPAPPVAIETPQVDGVTFPQPEFPDIDVDTDCMLVLYQGRNPATGAVVPSCAAIPMAGLSHQSFAPIYSGAVAQSTFQQPVITAQMTIGGQSFIHTDVDLSGRKQGASTLCTPMIVDAISLGAQVLPIFNGSGQVGSTYSLFTSACQVLYGNGKFTKGVTLGPGTYQPSAITRNGTCYFKPLLSTNQLQLDTDLSTADTSGYQDALDAASQKIYSYTKVYSVAWVRGVDTQGQASWSGNPGMINQTTTGSTGVTVTYRSYVGNGVAQEQSYLTDRLTALSVVSPQTNDTPTPPDQLNKLNVTVALGQYSYYECDYTDQKMTLGDLELLYGLTMYYGFDATDTLFHYQMPQGNVQEQVMSQLPRMVCNPGSSIAQVSLDPLTMGATLSQQTYTPPGLGITRLPGWEGYLLYGETFDPPETQPYPPYPPDDSADGIYGLFYVYPSSPDFGFVASGSDKEHELAVHTTLQLPAGGGYYASGTYEQIEESYQYLLGQLSVPTCTPNGEPGPMITGSAAITTTSMSTINTYTLVTEGETTRTQIGPTTTSAGELPPAPGYDASLLQSKYDYTLSWLDQQLEAEDDATANVTTAVRLDLAIFPFGASNSAFYTLKQENSSGYEDITAVTPYGTFANQNDKLVGWMNVVNADYLLHGIMIDTEPYIWLNGSDITTKLAAALGCAKTDIAACYFDINLSTIKQLAKIA